MPTYTRDQCPMCGSAAHRVLGPLDTAGAVLPPPADSTIRACRACRLVYVNPMPHWQPDEFNRLYADGYFDVSPAWEARRARDIPRYRLRIIERLIRCERRTALEIGAGVGAFMARHLADRGWQVDAQEPSAAFVDRLRHLDPRLTVRPEPFLALGTGRTYALIYADSVLEHVADPPPYFAHIARLLEPGGVLYFVAPNEYALGAVLATLRSRFGGGPARMLCPYAGSYHLIGYSRRAVELAGRRVGLQLVRFARERDFRWWHVLGGGSRSPLRYAHAAAVFAADAIGFGTNLEIAMRRADA